MKYHVVRIWKKLGKEHFENCFEAIMAFYTLEEAQWLIDDQFPNEKHNYIIIQSFEK